MVVCLWCGRGMTTADSCTVDAFHLDGRAVDMVAYGDEPGGTVPHRCGDCGVARGGHHHPGCDVQRCPSCRGQMITCGCLFDEDAPDKGLMGAGEPLMVDRDGLLVERRWMGGQEVIVHYDDIPATDVMVVSGIPRTTALRTVIDIAADVDHAHLQRIVRDCLDRRLFTVDEAWRRLSQPDMATRVGAALLRQVLPGPGRSR